MLIKQFQSQKSLLDYLMQIMPNVQLVELRHMVIPRKESAAANKLFSLWIDENNKVGKSTLKRPPTVSITDVENMQREGLVKLDGDKLQITSRGADVIKTMILGDDKSAFDGDSIVDYGTAYANCRKRGRVKTGGKMGGTVTKNNWYQRIAWE